MPIDIKIVLLSIFAVFGLFWLWQGNFSTFLHKKADIFPETVIIVKNAQDKIEGIVRNFYRRNHNNCANELWIVDGGSSDETAAILEKLSLEYAGLKSLLLPDMPAKACMHEVLKYLDEPLILMVDLTGRMGNENDIFL
ncbi:MAG: hypothetical protein NUV45_10235 [Tepidanaerobacteraceae bacterium]|nr:hypothetical protein [Tepidanaerobacteraceae bacterium]